MRPRTRPRGRGPGGEGEPLGALLEPPGRGDRQGGRRGPPRPDPPEPPVRGPRDPPRGREGRLRERPRGGRLRGDRRAVPRVRDQADAISARTPARNRAISVPARSTYDATRRATSSLPPPRRPLPPPP